MHPGRLIFGQLLLAPWVLGYKLGWVSGVRIRKKLVQFAYGGVRVETLVAAGARFANDYLPKALRAEAMARIAWHQDQGHRVVVVSGGLDCYLAPWCETQGLELICSALQHEQGVLTGRYLGLQCVRDEKARRVRERFDLTSFEQIYAYGDTPEDEDLLKLATRRYYRWREL